MLLFELMLCCVCALILLIGVLCVVGLFCFYCFFSYVCVLLSCLRFLCVFLTCWVVVLLFVFVFTFVCFVLCLSSVCVDCLRLLFAEWLYLFSRCVWLDRFMLVAVCLMC